MPTSAGGRECIPNFMTGEEAVTGQLLRGSTRTVVG